MGEPLLEQQHLSPGNMAVEPPPKPKPRVCLGDCGLMLEPEYVEPVVFNGKVMAFSNRWQSESYCPDCHERNTKTREESLRAEYERRRREKLEHMLGGPKPAEEFTFERFKTEPGNLAALQACRGLDPEHQNLYIWGPCGTGKTHLASAAAANLYVEGFDVLFFKPGPFLRSLRLRDSEQQSRMLRQYAESPVFVLDDLGVGASTEFAVQMLYELVDMRDSNRQNGLIVTSNLSLNDLADKLQDDRLSSRLAGLCKGNVIKIEGPDRRVPG
jgi:DNA replication protein DnaC